jgi:hypothetical protein
MSTGAAGAAPAGDAGQGQGDGGAGEAQGGLSTQQIAEALAANRSSQQEMFDYLRSQPWQQQEQQQPEQQQEAPGPLDLSFLDADEMGYQDPAQVASKLGDVLEKAVQQRLEAGLQPIQQAQQQQMEAQQEMRREQEFAALIGEFPELGEEETATQVLQMTGQLAQAAGHPELSGEPWLTRLVYMAGRAADAAQQEAGDTPSLAHSESGAGAAPAGGSGAMTADQIVGARRGASVLPFG